MLLQELLAQIEHEKAEEEERKRGEAAAKREELNQGEQNRDKAVDDSRTIEELFGFLPPEVAAVGEGKSYY